MSESKKLKNKISKTNGEGKENKTPSSKNSSSNKYPFKIDFTLTERQKQFSAVLISLIILALVSFGVVFSTNLTFKDYILNGSKIATNTSISGTELDQSLDDLGQSLTKLNIDSILYDTINLDNLPIYPKAWVERFFSGSEIQNALISGPSADPDKDGLSNKQEFLLGSNPREKDSLCLGKIDGKKCNGKTDGENVANNISPLTGGIISSNRTFRVNKQNTKLLDTLQSSFENASKEGVDFPTLYQLSKEIDLTDYFNSFKVTTVEDNRDSFSNYLQLRSGIIQGFVDDSELNSLTEIYSTNSVSQLEIVRQTYQNRLDILNNAAVPKRYTETHKAYLSIFSKIIQLLDLRIQGIKDNTFDNDKYKESTRKTAVEIVWGYKKLNQEVTNLGGK